MRPLLLIAPLFVLAACGGTQTKPVVINPQSCNIEAPVSKAEVAANAEINVLGWFFDKFSANSKAGVRVQLASADRKVIKSVTVADLTARGDVAEAFKEPLAEKSGLGAKFAPNELAPGTYDLSVIRETDEAIIVCANGHTITVK